MSAMEYVESRGWDWFVMPASEDVIIVLWKDLSAIVVKKPGPTACEAWRDAVKEVRSQS
jgi:hypothetical protein